MSPADELHCMLWVVNTSNVLHNNSNNICENNNKVDKAQNSENKINNVLYVLLLGNESGQILYYTFEADKISGKIRPCNVTNNKNNDNTITPL